MALKRELPIICLPYAFLCSDLDCKTISINTRNCPVCGSQVQSLSKVLNRETL
jgi:uncharacterized protein (UPF0212 family)